MRTPRAASRWALPHISSFVLFATRFPSSLADRRETLPHDRNVGALYNGSPKIRGPSPQRNWGPKTCKIRRDFRQLQISIANRSRYPKSVRNLFTNDSFRVRRRKSGELWSSNYRELDVSLDPPKLHFSEDYISALRGAGPSNFNTR